MASFSTSEFNPRAISVVLLDQAKRFWGWSLAVGIIGPLFGLASSFAPSSISLAPVVAPSILVVLAMVAEALQWRSDAVKDVAEALLRKLDLQDSFGWSISRREVSDLLAQNEGLSREFAAHLPKEAYFGSAEPPSVERALANLEESAWWSKHLAREIGNRCLLIVASLVVVAVVALVVSVEAVKEATATHAVETLHAVGNVVTASLTLVFSLGLTRLAVSYTNFSSNAEKIEAQASHTAAVPNVAEGEVVKLWQDYHLARATAPFIPTWFWKMKRDRLNAIWDARQKRL